MALALAGCGGQNSSLAAPPQAYQQPLPNQQQVTIASSFAPLVRAKVISAALAHKPSDVAVWANPGDPAKSLAFVTVGDSDGKVVVLALDGKPVQEVAGLQSPRGIDVHYGLRTGKTSTDFVAVAESGTGKIRLFTIDRKTGKLSDVSGTTSLGEGHVISSLALYQSKSGHQAFVSLSSPTADAVLLQLKLTQVSGKVNAAVVRSFGQLAEPKPQAPVDGAVREQVVTPGATSLYVDSPKGTLYYTDPSYGVREYPADAASKPESRVASGFARTGVSGLLRGIAAAKSHFVCLDSAKGGSMLRLFPRDVRGEKPEAYRVKTEIEEAGALEVVTKSLGKAFPAGLAVVTDPTSRSVHFFDWDQLLKAAAGRSTEAQPVASPSVTSR